RRGPRARAVPAGAHGLVAPAPRRAGGRSRVMPYASVFPLVTTRARARAFSYEVEEGAGRRADAATPVGQCPGRRRLGAPEDAAPFRSGLTHAERRDERARIVSGEARIVVGARSAIFAPVAGLGLIVVDEEHDASYKQDSDPRYDARTVAAKRATLEGAVAVYG